MKNYHYAQCADSINGIKLHNSFEEFYLANLKESKINRKAKETWLSFFLEQSKKEYFGNLVEFLLSETNSKNSESTPNPKVIFKIFSLIALDKIRVIIVGQRPLS